MILCFGKKLIKRHLSGTLRRQTGLPEDNLNRFYNNLSDSIDLIRKDSPDCRIAIMTLYNPYRNMDYEISAGGITVNIGQYAEEKISQANTIIRTVCKEKNIVLADCYEAFASSNDIVLNNQNAENYIDPDDHPTASGTAVNRRCVYRSIVYKVRCNQKPAFIYQVKWK